MLGFKQEHVSVTTRAGRNCAQDFSKPGVDKRGHLTSVKEPIHRNIPKRFQEIFILIKCPPNACWTLSEPVWGGGQRRGIHLQEQFEVN